MADKKISELTALTGANVATDDQLVIVDTSAALTKSITIDEFKNALDTATGFVRITGDTMTGALTTTGLTVSGDAVFTPDNDGVRITGANYATLRLEENDTTDLNTTMFNSGGAFSLYTSNDARSSLTQRLNIDHTTGDISFYNASGNTGFLWDVSEESLGIGTTNITDASWGTGNKELAIDGTTGYGIIHLRGTGAGSTDTRFSMGVGDSKFYLAYDDVAGAHRIIVDSSGNVGIGTSSFTSYGNSQATLVIEDTGSPAIAWSDTGQARDWFAVAQGSGLFFNYADGGGSGSATNVTNVLTLDNSGNVGIGTDSPSESLTNRGNIFIETNSTSADSGNGLFWQSTTSGWSTSTAHAAIYGKRTDASNGYLRFDTRQSGTTQEAMRIDSSGNLLVGTTDTTVYDNNTETTADNGLNLRGDGKLDAARYNGIVLGLNLTGNDGTLAEFRKNGASVGSIGATSSNLTISSSASGRSGLYFGSGAIFPMNGGSLDGADQVSIGSPNYQFANLYLSGGVVFGDAGGSGTSSSNTLDSYEEGTWTPLITGSASNPSSTANATNLGFYTKIGRQVTVCFRVDYGSVSGGSGNFEISGLPFTSNSNSYFRSSGNISFFRGVTHGGNRLAPHAITNSTKFIFYKLANTSEFDDVILTSALSSSVSIHGFYIYFTD